MDLFRKGSFLRYSFIFFLTLFGVIFILYTVVIYKFKSIRATTLDKLPRHMIWAHRGYTKGFPENSLESFDAAKRMGYYGIELDIFYIEGKGFIVSHDNPQNNKTYLSLETVFNRYKDQFYYWLDFKNLEIENALKTGTVLNEYMKKYALEGRVFIESKKARALQKLKSISPQINTIYWLKGHLKEGINLLKSKYYTVITGGDTISIPLKYADDIFLDNYSHLNMAVFTVNDEKTIEYLFKKGVRLILTDVDVRESFPYAFKLEQNSE